MTLAAVSPPYLRQRLDTGQVMRQVVIATLPGMAVMVWFFGHGVLINVMLAVTAALAAEAAVLRLRGRPVARTLGDCSALLTGVLLGLALPPLTPFWMTLLGAALAIVFGKQLYGGIGFNPFNPAMIGYAILLISFPLEMTSWLLPRGADGASPPGLLEAARLIFGFTLDGATGGQVDAMSGATPLDDFKYRENLTVAEWQAASNLTGTFAGRGWDWVNLAFLGGGLYLLLYRRLFTWHAPVAMLASLALCAALFWDGGSSASHGSPLFHLLGGATMFGAFFIVTDPVSSATSPQGRLVFGAGVGVLLYAIRAWGNYPDAVAFAVLLMNLAAPLIDHYTRPRIYGHTRGHTRGHARQSSSQAGKERPS